jgi:SAM-dependent methyltransferase
MNAQTTPSAETARSFLEASSFIWHQRWELVPGVETPGIHSLQYLFDLAQLPDPTGLSVLDIGTANGGAAFLLERQGARSVVAIDVFSEDQFGFGATREFLGSKAEYIQGTVYELGRVVDGQKFDLVVFWGVLYHLRHPLLALDEVRSVLAPGGLVSIETAVGDDDVGSAATLPVARFYAGDEFAGDASNWFSPTVACVGDWCDSSGLEELFSHVWGEGQMKRLIGSYRATPGPAPFTQISYEVPLRAEPVVDSTGDRPRKRRSISLTDRYPPPERPWSHEYAETHRRFVSEVLDDPELVALFRSGGELPSGFGVGLDERVVEFPWLFAHGLEGDVLDAGSSLNHEHVLDRVLPLVSRLHVVTLQPEAKSFPERRVSYVYADLRDLPYRDSAFDTVVSLSTLEHVGMDNSGYGVEQPPSTDPAGEVRRALAELERVGPGRLLVTVPYGRREDHGWFRQFDRDDIERLCETVSGTATTTVFRYTSAGWCRSDLTEASEMVYRDFTADRSPVDDLAAAARAVACIAIEG